MAEETARGLLRIVRVGKQLKRTRRHYDRAIGAGEFELLHGLLEQPGGQTKLFCLLSANGQHLRETLSKFFRRLIVIKQQKRAYPRGDRNGIVQFQRSRHLGASRKKSRT